MSVLCLDGVSYRYPAMQADALRDVSLQVEPGEFCVVAGLSGSGKSTLLRAAAGLVPHFYGGMFGGTVVVEGLDTRANGPAEIGAVAGTLLQDPETQIVMATVRAELELPLENHGYEKAAIARAVEETALSLGIAQLLDRPTGELSGGEMQRVALAAVLVSRPRLVLLDEPTSQLDPVAGDELIWQLRRLNQESDTAVIVVEHRLERCLIAADRVIVLADGSIVCDADPAAFLQWAGEYAPDLRTPAARLFSGLGLRPAPNGVKQARATLRRHRLLPTALKADASHPYGRRSAFGVSCLSRRRAKRDQAGAAALQMHGVWHELHNGPAILRGVQLALQRGEAVVLMGRNGAGKSTLLRHAAGLLEPTRGRVARDGRVALLLQNPGDYLLHERVAEEASADALALAGLGELGERHPRDLSGGQRQRLALAIVLDGPAAASTIALDEPTRGMDPAAKHRLASWLREQAAAGRTVIVATHDCEFAAEFATRAVLLADGRVIADGPIEQVLSGGWYFTTETARILDGAGGALRPEQGIQLILAHCDPANHPELVISGPEA